MRPTNSGLPVSTIWTHTFRTSHATNTTGSVTQTRLGGIGDVSNWDIFAGEVSSEVLYNTQNLYDWCISQVDAEI